MEMKKNIRTNFKVKPWRSKPYRDFIKSQTCCVCPNPADDPHHEQREGHGGMGTTCGDERCLPLCRQHHDERQHGKLGRGFWQKYRRDPDALMVHYQRMWERSGGKLPTSGNIANNCC